MRNFSAIASKMTLFAGGFNLLLILLIGCAPIGLGESTPSATATLPALQTTTLESMHPSLLAEWNMGTVNDMAWNPDSSTFVVDFTQAGSISNNIQLFDTKSTSMIWKVDNISSFGIAFTPNGHWLVQSPEPFTNTMRWRSVDQGKEVGQIQTYDCSIGQVILSKPGGDTFLVADRSNQTITVDAWDIDFGQCKNLVQYVGFLQAFDVNTKGNLLLGVIDPDNHYVVWDEFQQKELCHTNVGDESFAYFVPGQNTFALFVDQSWYSSMISVVENYESLRLIELTLHSVQMANGLQSQGN